MTIIIDVIEDIKEAETSGMDMGAIFPIRLHTATNENFPTATLVALRLRSVGVGVFRLICITLFVIAILLLGFLVLNVVIFLFLVYLIRIFVTFIFLVLLGSFGGNHFIHSIGIPRFALRTYLVVTAHATLISIAI
jgi:hypothetical protein